MGALSDPMPNSRCDETGGKAAIRNVPCLLRTLFSHSPVLGTCACGRTEPHKPQLFLHPQTNQRLLGLGSKVWRTALVTHRRGAKRHSGGSGRMVGDTEVTRFGPANFHVVRNPDAILYRPRVVHKWFCRLPFSDKFTQVARDSG